MSQDSNVSSATPSLVVDGVPAVKKHAAGEEVEGSEEQPRHEKQDNTKPVLPWENTKREVNVKTFTGYNLNLNGWIRKDVMEQQIVEREQVEHDEQSNEEK